MAIIKCKMCGGDLVLAEGSTVATCEYCGSRQTVPSADNEKKLNLFASANKLRAACEFDRAAGVYDAIKAEFPDEAEAYWGLVLCKYGIEYVDDPATGRKVPTCHRSSFDSIMDDGNFEQALENADAVARKVYREEGRVLEEIRKGILEVSSKQEPYDIFICYKETDAEGNRTLDSVLAQDLYTALTDKGYRVFFSRVTLKGQLGQAYEPYIFAALHSAKVMLAIGTDYDYFNAVWVKNEWSRYLKIMAQSKDKHLIPCFKGIDAYDMPKEFRPLQAVDLGQMGAVQDIVFNMEKYIPLKKNTTVIQERVVVGGAGGNNKIASLLDRGNMALEDGDWAKADSFFEDVLNNDSKNAQAYIGKTLAQERCRTIDAFVRKRKGLYETVKGQKLALEPATKHIEEMAVQYRVRNYLTAEAIQALYQFDLHYHSDVADRRQQYQKEVSYWATHKLLSRAEKFATGAVAENLQREKKALFAALSEQVKKAEATEAGHKKSVQDRYAQHIAQADARAAELSQEALANREQDYRNWIIQVKNSEDLEILRGAEEFFAAQGDYQKCPALALHCRKRIADITAENERKEAEAKAAAEAEAERKRIAKAKADAARKKKNKTIAIITVLVIALVIAAAAVVTMVIIPNSKLGQAQSLMDSGDYQGAYDILINLNGYKNSEEMLDEVGQHGMYAVVAAHKDDLDYFDGTDYDYTMTYTEKGLPLTYQSVSNQGDRSSQLFEYTWYESGNPESCTVRYESGEINFVVNFYDTADSGIVYRPGEGLNRNHYGYTSYEWVFFGTESVDDYYKEEINHTYHYTEKGINKKWICEFDAEGRLVKHYEAEDEGYTILTYNENGEINVRTVVEDRDEPDSIWNDKYEYIYNYDAKHRLISWSYDWIYDVPERRENYTYDESVNVIQIDTFKRDEYYSGDEYLAEDYTCTLTYEWLDFAELAGQAAGMRAEQEAAQAAQEEQLAADYAAAEALYAAGDYREAALAFAALGDYSDAADRFQSIWSQIDKSCMLSAGYGYTLGVNADGTVRGSSSNVEEWLTGMNNIVAISATDAHAVGLRADGTVVAGGDNSFEQLNVGGWTDMVAVSAGTYHTVGLKADGTVIATGFNDYGQCDVSGWTNIVAIAAAQVHTVGLRADGTVVAIGFNDDGRCNVEEWTDIIQIAACNDKTLGLKSDGTVVAVGGNKDGELDVSGWTNIVAIEAGYFHTMGLRSDGTVVAAGYNEPGQCNVGSWSDIVAIWAGGYHSIGMKADGTVVTVGDDSNNQHAACDWTDMMYQN